MHARNARLQGDKLRGGLLHRLINALTGGLHRLCDRLKRRLICKLSYNNRHLMQTGKLRDYMSVTFLAVLGGMVFGLTRPDALPDMPYVVANEDTRTVAAEPYRAFVRGLDEHSPGDQVVIARLSYQFEEVEAHGRKAVRQNLMRGNLGAVPSDERPIQVGRRLNPFAPEGDVIGYQLWEVARAEVLTRGDPAQLEVLDAEMEVRPGDYILPIDPYLYDLTFYPRAPEFDVPEGASIIGVRGGDNAVAHYQIVALDLGIDDGVEPGHTFSVFHNNRVVEDEFVDGLRGRPAPAGVSGRRVQLPPQYIGQVMVFRAFDRVSYALVMTGKRGVRTGDLIDHPDRRL